MGGSAPSDEAEEEDALVARCEAGLGGFAEDEAVVGVWDLGEMAVERGEGEVLHAGAGGFFADDEEEGNGEGAGVLVWVGGGRRGEEGEDGVDLGSDAGFGVDGAAAGDEDVGAVDCCFPLEGWAR